MVKTAQKSWKTPFKMPKIEPLQTSTFKVNKPSTAKKNKRQSHRLGNTTPSKTSPQHTHPATPINSESGVCQNISMSWEEGNYSADTQKLPGNAPATIRSENFSVDEKVAREMSTEEINPGPQRDIVTSQIPHLERQQRPVPNRKPIWRNQALPLKSVNVNGSDEDIFSHMTSTSPGTQKVLSPRFGLNDGILADQQRVGNELTSPSCSKFEPESRRKHNPVQSSFSSRPDQSFGHTEDTEDDNSVSPQILPEQLTDIDKWTKDVEKAKGKLKKSIQELSRLNALLRRATGKIWTNSVRNIDKTRGYDQPNASTPKDYGTPPPCSP